MTEAARQQNLIRSQDDETKTLIIDMQLIMRQQNM